MALRDSLRASLVPYGAQVELLADGSLVATLMPERGTATDQVTLAARCALTFKERWPESEVVLVTGMGVLNERLPVGDAMERAGRLLKRMGREPSPMRWCATRPMAWWPRAPCPWGTDWRAPGWSSGARWIPGCSPRTTSWEELACRGAFAVGLRLTLAEACLSLGEVAEAEAALREAVRCVGARARDVPEPLLRERFLREVPANVRALALARERWGEDYLTGK